MLTTVLAGALKVRVTQNCGFDGVLPWMWLEPVKLYIHTWLYQVVDRSQASLPALRKEARVLLNLSAGEASGMLKADFWVPSWRTTTRTRQFKTHLPRVALWACSTTPWHTPTLRA
jgi:hypothetical protein